jgi:nucleoside-diphosphate-sugar epimerase
MSAVNPEHSVLLLGGTGRTGGRVLTQLLERDVPVRAIVRSAERLPADVVGHPLLDVVEADLLSLTLEELRSHLEGRDTVISCLGHNNTNLKGIFGPPFSIVAAAVANVARAIEAMQPARPVRFILMSTVAANVAGTAEAVRGAGQRFFLGVLRTAVPPARDNQRAADFLVREIGPDNAAVEWVAVRPDTLVEGDVTDYRLHDQLVSSVFKADDTNMANVAHFMCELACDDDAWRRWRGRMPVIVNAGAKA